MFFTFPEDAHWNDDRQAVELGIEIGEYAGTVRVGRRVFQRLLSDSPTPERGVEGYHLHRTRFAHPPRGFTALLILRDRIVTPFGLRPSGAAERKAIEIKPAYAVGDKIARFTLFGQNDTEIVTGGDDTHLDFRVSVRTLTQDGAKAGCADHDGEPTQPLRQGPICASSCPFTVLASGCCWQTRSRPDGYKAMLLRYHVMSRRH